MVIAFVHVGMCGNAATEVSKVTLRILNEESSLVTDVGRFATVNPKKLMYFEPFQHPYGGHKLFL